MKTSSKNKRRWWLKLEAVFFQDKAVRALRRKNPAAPDIYLKMMLQSLRTDCRMQFQHYEESLAEEIAGDINEDDVELIDDIIRFLLHHNLMIQEEGETYYFPQAGEMSGSETDSAGRMRDKRERDRLREMSKSDDDMSHCSVVITETESEQEKEKESKTESDTHTDSDSESAFVLDSVRFSSDFIKRICRENHIKATDADIGKYCDEMTAAGWKDSKGNKIQNIGAHIRTWLKYHSVFIETFADDYYCFYHTVEEIYSLISGLNCPMLSEAVQQGVHDISQQADQDALSGKHACYAVLEQACKYLRENGFHFTEAQELLLESIPNKRAWIFFDYCDSEDLAAVFEDIAGVPPKWDEKEMKAADNGEYEDKQIQAHKTDDKEVAFSKLREFFGGEFRDVGLKLAMYNISNYLYGNDNDISSTTKQIMRNKMPGDNSTAKEKSKYISWVYKYLTEEVCEIDIREDELFCIETLKDVAPDMLFDGKNENVINEIMQTKLKGDYSGDFEEV